MAVLTRPRKNRKAPKTAATEAPTPRVARETEAPDRGASHEAPDSGRLKIAEAPDAGHGRSALIEHEFTHGRSQS